MIYHIAIGFLCWLCLCLLVWPWFVVAGRADDAMERYAASRSEV